MTVELAKDVEEFLQEQVREHVCADPSQLVNDIIRSLRDQRKKPFEVTEELEAWLLKSAEGNVTPLSKADFDRIRARVRAGSDSQ